MNFFSHTISPTNQLEGITIAWSNKNNTLKKHIDKNNCPCDGYNAVIGASLCLEDERYVVLGYGKKSCSDFIDQQNR